MTEDRVLEVGKRESGMRKSEMRERVLILDFRIMDGRLSAQGLYEPYSMPYALCPLHSAL